MVKYRIGDKVKIKSLEEFEKDNVSILAGMKTYTSSRISEDMDYDIYKHHLYSFGGTDRRKGNMFKYVGKVVTIRKVYAGAGYLIKEDGGLNRWNRWIFDSNYTRKNKVIGILNEI